MLACPPKWHVLFAIGLPDQWIMFRKLCVLAPDNRACANVGVSCIRCLQVGSIKRLDLLVGQLFCFLLSAHHHHRHLEEKPGCMRGHVKAQEGFQRVVSNKALSLSLSPTSRQAGSKNTPAASSSCFPCRWLALVTVLSRSLSRGDPVLATY